MHSQLTDLRTIAQKALSGTNYVANVLGVVIDSTGAVYRPKQADYCLRLRLIDPTLNQRHPYAVMSKDCAVYMFSKIRQEIMIAGKIGDIFYLRQFSFGMWNCVKLQTRFTGALEVMCGLDVEKGTVRVGKKLSVREVDEGIIEEIGLSSILLLKEWFLSEFTSVFRPQLGIPLISNYGIVADSFNMIMRVAGAKDFLHLEDRHKNNCFVKANPAVLSRVTSQHTPQYVYLRGLKCLSHQFELQFTEAGFIMFLPEEYSHHYEELMNYCSVHRCQDRLILSKMNQLELTQLVHCSVSPSPVSEIIELTQRYRLSSKKEDFRTQELFLIHAVIIAFEGDLYLFHADYQTIYDEELFSSLSAEEKEQCLKQHTVYFIYEGRITVMDRSTEAREQMLCVRLFTYDEKGQFFKKNCLSSLNESLCSQEIFPDVYSKALWGQALRSIESSLDKLVRDSSFEKPAALLLEPVKSDELVFRLINTRIV